MIIIIINIITTTTTIIIISYIIVNNMNIITNINKIIQMAENAENRPWLSFGTHNTLGHNRHCLLRAKGHSWPKNLVLGRHGRQPSSSSRPGCFCSPNNKFCLGFLSEMSVVYVSVLQNLLLPVLTASPLFWWRALQKFQTFFWLIEYQQLAFQRRSRVGIRERCFCVSFFVIFLQIPRFSPRFPRNPKFTSFFVIFFYFFVIKTLFSMQNENFSPAGPKFSTPLETAHPGGAPKGFHTPFALFFFRVAFWMPILHPPPPPAGAWPVSTSHSPGERHPCSQGAALLGVRRVAYLLAAFRLGQHNGPAAEVDANLKAFLRHLPWPRRPHRQRLLGLPSGAGRTQALFFRKFFPCFKQFWSHFFSISRAVRASNRHSVFECGL